MDRKEADINKNKMAQYRPTIEILEIAVIEYGGGGGGGGARSDCYDANIRKAHHLSINKYFCLVQIRMPGTEARCWEQETTQKLNRE